MSDATREFFCGIENRNVLYKTSALAVEMRRLMHGVGIETPRYDERFERIEPYNRPDEAEMAILADFSAALLQMKPDLGMIEEALPEELRRRLMPEGMEWPRFEDGEPVRLGDIFCDAYGWSPAVEMVMVLPGRFRLYAAPNDYSMLDDYVSFDDGELVKRPPVLAKDGRPIEVGQTVYGGDGGAWEVLGFDRASDYPVLAVSMESSLKRASGERRELKPEWLTHDAPELLLSDGEPYWDGQTVWADDGERLTVMYTANAGGHVVCRRKGGGKRSVARDRLSHREPDSWERLDEDARSYVHEYWGCTGIPCSRCPATIDGKTPAERYETGGSGTTACCKAMGLSIARRAKKLAAVE